MLINFDVNGELITVLIPDDTNINVNNKWDNISSSSDYIRVIIQVIQ